MPTNVALHLIQCGPAFRLFHLSLTALSAARFRCVRALPAFVPGAYSAFLPETGMGLSCSLVSQLTMKRLMPLLVFLRVGLASSHARIFRSSCITCTAGKREIQ